MSNSQPENNSVTKDEYGRRTWDKEAYLARAHQRGLNEEFPFDTDERRKRRIVPQEERKPLTARDYEYDFKKVIGQRKTLAGPEDTLEARDQAGFYCKLCDMNFKDSSAYMDHINSRRHQFALGHSMRPVQSTLEDVRRRLREIQQQKNRKKKKVLDDLEAQALKEKEEEERRKKEELEKKLEELDEKKKKAKAEKKEREKKKEEEKKKMEEEQEKKEEEELPEDLKLAKALGLPIGFGTSKKKK